MQETGPYNGQGPSYEMRPTGTTSLTWVHGKHTFKLGSEMDYEQAYSKPHPLVTLTTGTGPTSDPFTNVNSYGSFSPGFGFASFLLGDYTSTSQSVPIDTRLATFDWAVYIQDSYKVTRKLTVDYGLRWDYDTPEKEQYNRWGQLDASLANTSAGGHPSAPVRQQLQLRLLQERLSFRDWASRRRCVSDQQQDRASRRLGS
jgi:hypothetical protein